jgi:NAD(P)-dependent dehydrogenase (short-subunit alcohol dehydrogenase family)
MMQDFAGKTAVITGAGSGIGAALAQRAAAEGMNVVLADIRPEDAERVADTLPGGPHLVVATDVSEARSVETLAARAWDRFGSVDLLFNNAGVVPGGRHRFVWELAPQDWAWSLGVNLDGLIHGIRSFVPRMIAAGTPAHIVNTTSVAGFVSGAGTAAYGTAKFAAVRVTEALYDGLRQIGAPIGVTMLVPGLVATNIRNAERFRPAHLKVNGEEIEESAELRAISDALYEKAPTPDFIADMTFDGIRKGAFYLFSSTSFDAAIRDRNEAILGRTNPDFRSIVEMSKQDSGFAG